MWEIVGPARAEFRANGWCFAALAQPTGLMQFCVSRLPADGPVGSPATPPSAVSEVEILFPEHALPNCSECYARGDELHMSFPVSITHPVGLKLVLLAVEADASRLVIESVLAVNTDLLESFPELHLRQASGSQSPACESEHRSAAAIVWHRVGTAGATKISKTTRSSDESPLDLAVICDARDHSSLSADWHAGEPCVRFWGEFLEKGVTRKVQPWWVWSTERLSPETVAEVAEHLAARPLPLVS